MMNYKKTAVIMFVLLLAIVPISMCLTDCDSDATGKYIVSAEKTGNFTDHDDGKITVKFCKQSTETTFVVTMKDANGATYLTQETVIPASDDYVSHEYSFRIGSSGPHFVNVLVNIKDSTAEPDTAQVQIDVEHSLWSDPWIYIVIVIAVIVVLVIAFIKYRSITDAKKNNPKEKVFTKMAEEKKKGK